MILFILGSVWWLIKTSEKEAPKHKGIPEKAKPWIKIKSVLGWLSLLAFLGLMIQPVQALAGVFLTLLGAHYLCYGVTVYWAEQLESMGFGTTYYGKAAKALGIFIFGFGLIIFLIGSGGLLTMLL